MEHDWRLVFNYTKDYPDGSNLKRLRLQMNKTQEEVARDLGISVIALANYESNLRIPQDETLKKFETYFSVQQDEIVGDKLDKSKTKFYIYALQHLVTKKIYVGNTKNLKRRFINHISSLAIGEHWCAELQKDFDLYGNEILFYILEEYENPKQRVHAYGTTYCTKGQLLEYEWMNKLDTLNTGYNIQDHVAKRFIRNRHR